MDPEISPELKTVLEKLEGTFVTQQKELDVKLKKLGEDSADYLAHKDQSVTAMLDVTKQIDEIKAAINRIPAQKDSDAKKELTDERKAFQLHLATGTSELKSMDHELKTTLQVGDDERGGYLVTPEIGTLIDTLQQEISPMRSLVNVIQIMKGDALEAPTIVKKDAGATRRSELTTSTDASDIKFGNKRIAVTWLDAVVPASVQALDDIGGLETMLAQFAAEDFTITEGAEMINGNGVGQARGILDVGSTVISEVNSGAAATFTTTGLLSLVGALKPAYRGGASFIANRSSIFTYLFGLKDSDGQHYLVPDFRNGFSFNLLGFPLIEEPNMPDTAATATPLAFGNFRRAYNWVERKQLSLFVDPYTARPVTKYIWSKRSGGDVVVPEALKIQVIGA